MESRKLLCMGAAAFVSSLLVISTAALADPQEPFTVQGRVIDPDLQRVVPYSDLNLAEAPGRKTLLRRVGFAVRSICQDQAYAVTSLDYQVQERSCSAAAWDSANPQITDAFERARLGGSLTTAALTITSVR